MNILILGAGDIGFQLCKRLSPERHNITIIESDTQKANRAKEYLDAFVIEGDATGYKQLEEGNIQKADVVAALTNNDEVNLMACRIAKKYGVEVTIARVRNPDYCSPGFVLSKEELGADYIVQPERQTAKAIVRLIRQSSATDIIEIHSGKIRMFGIRLDDNSPLLHTPLKELGSVFSDPPTTLVAIKRRQFTIIPRGDDILVKGDQVFLITHPDNMEKVLANFGKADSKVEDIMIIGGGLIGRYIAEELQKEINVKIIEQDEKKSIFLAEKLKKTLVINGDGSDLDLLTLESLQDMDEFITVSGDDETNIITSLLARHLKVPRTITLISKLEYSSLAPSIGMDAVISKQLITVNSIQKFIRRQQVAFFAEIPGVDAEIIEYIAGEKSKIIRKPLKDTHFPNHSVIGAVLKKDGMLEIPKGDTHIEAGDKVVVFMLPRAQKAVEKLF